MNIVRRKVRDFTIMSVRGRLNWENSQELDKALNQEYDSGARRVALILDEVTFLCSGGIGALIYNLNRLRRSGGELHVIFSSDYLTFMFGSLKFDLLFGGHMFESYEKFCERVFGEYLPLPA